MKKTITILFLFLTILLAGCNGGNENNDSEVSKAEKKIYQKIKSLKEEEQLIKSYLKGYHPFLKIL
ncbi:hypothetical protein A6P54_20895 [Bacillus sp. MKU004]|nr:hypothetical protein A6P54_20895 [Bacillus sp. MKU004]